MKNELQHSCQRDLGGERTASALDAHEMGRGEGGEGKSDATIMNRTPSFSWCRTSLWAAVIMKRTKGESLVTSRDAGVFFPFAGESSSSSTNSPLMTEKRS